MKGRKPSGIVAGSIGEVPRPPAWLSKDAKAEWRRIMPDLVERRVLTDADLGGVENYCIAIGRVREIESMLRAGFYVRLFRAQNQAIETARRIGAEIGATPVSRSRPAIREGDGEDLSYLD